MKPGDRPSPACRTPLPAWATLGGLMAMMVVLRVFPGWFFLVRSDGEFRLPDPDAYYHFRQAVYTVQHFPRLLRWDDFSHYPAILRNDAAGLYDLTLAGLGRIVALSGMPPLRALWWVCLWFPPLCATSIMVFVYLLVRRQGTVAIGLTMALWYLLLPGLTLSHMTFGICDHHVVEMLIGVLCILLLERLVEGERERPSAWWRPAWGAALPLAILQFTWLGGPLFLVIFAVAGLGQLAADVLAGAGARALVRAGVRYWLAFFVLTGAAGVICPDLIFLPYLWRATLAGAAAVLVALPATGWFFETRFGGLGWRCPPAFRLALWGGFLAVMAGVLYRCSPSIREFCREGLGPKSLIVAENQVVTAPFYFGVTGLAGILGLLAPLAGIVSGLWRRPAWWIAVLPSVSFIALWHQTYDYGYQGALHAILLTGYFLGALAVWLSPRAGLPGWRGLKPSLAALSLAVFLCRWPAGWTAPWWLPRDWYLTGPGMPSEGWIEAMRWLRTAAPRPPPLPVHPVRGQPPRGRIGVLTDWCEGQFVNTLAGLPATDSRYPDSEGMAPFFLRTEEAVRAAPLRGSTVAAAVRYVALEPRTIADAFGAHREAIGLKPRDFYGRATFLNGQRHRIGAPTFGPAYDAAFATRLLIHDGDGFSHFRLIFESREQSFLRLTYDPLTKALVPRAGLVLNAPLRDLALRDLRLGLWQEGGWDAYEGHLLAAVKIFEQVEGARVAGRAPPGATVVLRVPLHLRTSGRSWQYRQSCRVGVDGRFELTEPYATEPASGTDLVPDGPALLILEGLPVAAGGIPASRKAVLTIPEASVEGGEVVKWRGWLGRPPEERHEG